MRLTLGDNQEVIEARSNDRGFTRQPEYVQNSPEETAKMFEDLLQGIVMIKQQASELNSRFDQLKPSELERATQDLHEVITLLGER